MQDLEFWPPLSISGSRAAQLGNRIMQNVTSGGSLDRIALAVSIVAGYVSNNAVRAVDLPDLLTSIHAAVTSLDGGTSVGTVAEPVAERPSAAQIRKSVGHDGIVSFIDGRIYKTLKRHLTAHGLDPRAYRERYGLPADYPMVAPSYAAKRSDLARAIGLGRPGAMAEREQRAERSRRHAA